MERVALEHMASWQPEADNGGTCARTQRVAGAHGSAPGGSIDSKRSQRGLATEQGDGWNRSNAVQTMAEGKPQCSTGD